jgi:hypothetical protein
MAQNADALPATATTHRRDRAARRTQTARAGRETQAAGSYPETTAPSTTRCSTTRCSTIRYQTMLRSTTR